MRHKPIIISDKKSIDKINEINQGKSNKRHLEIQSKYISPDSQDFKEILEFINKNLQK